MPLTCCAPFCKSRKNRCKNKSFFRIPVNVDQRQKWISAMKRKDWQPTPYSRLCGDHFITGKPSKCPSHPDYVPSMFTFSKKTDSHAQQTLDRYNRYQRHSKRQRDADTASSSLLPPSKQPRRQSAENDAGMPVYTEAISGGAVYTGDVPATSVHTTVNSTLSTDAEVDPGLSADPTIVSGSSVDVSIDLNLSDNSSLSEQLKNENTELREQLKTIQLENERMRALHIQLHADNKSLKSQNSELTSTSLALKVQNMNLTKSCRRLKCKAHNLESEVQAVKFGVDIIKDDNKATCFYTGLPKFALFLTLFNLLKVHASVSQGLKNFFLS